MNVYDRVAFSHAPVGVPWSVDEAQRQGPGFVVSTQPTGRGASVS